MRVGGGFYRWKSGPWWPWCTGKLGGRAARHWRLRRCMNVVGAPLGLRRVRRGEGGRCPSGVRTASTVNSRAFVSVATSWWGRGHDVGMSGELRRARGTARMSGACRGAEMACIGISVDVLGWRGLGRLNKVEGGLSVCSGAAQRVRGGTAAGRRGASQSWASSSSFCRVSSRRGEKEVLAAASCQCGRGFWFLCVQACEGE